MKRITLQSIIFLIVIGAYAQKPKLQFEEIKDHNGSSFYNILKIKQDYNGFLWFVMTIEGMYRYDGVTITPFLYDTNDSSTVYSTFAKYFFGRDGSFLISSQGRVVDFNALRTTENQGVYFCK